MNLQGVKFLLLVSVIFAPLASGCSPQVATVELPASIELTLEETRIVTATVKDDKGAPIQGTLDKPIGVELVWESDNPAVVTARAAAIERQWSPQGHLVAKAPGSATVTAQHADGARASVAVTVVAKPSSGTAQDDAADDDGKGGTP